ncbi:uncharacterized protein LOC121371793 [Gigantopelta aegis]|uniref:uncharacterized protein LOC121371793 n=1 Tax=Gigantopelta aegis TaxID=1735272 RepID=UPI001B88961F|nr:uncharacterized protein LOC121371793 [Gigantopelta aegis]
MLKMHCPLGVDTTFRLAHDISPDILGDDDDEDDYKIKEFITETYSCWYSKESVPEDSVIKDRGSEKDSIAERNAKNLYLKDQAPSYTDVVCSKIEDYEADVKSEKQTAKCAQNEDYSDISDLDSNRSSPDQVISCTKQSSKPGCQATYSAKIHESGGNHARRPRKLPDIPINHEVSVARPSMVVNTKSLFEELQEARDRQVEEGGGADDVFLTNSLGTYTGIRKRTTDILERSINFHSVPRNSTTFTNCDNPFITEDSSTRRHSSRHSSSGSDGCGSKKSSTSSLCYVASSLRTEMNVTHRGMHHFIPRHPDEMIIEIGDPIHVITEHDDLWCEGVNLKTGQKGIFPAMYAIDLHFLEEESDEEDCQKFNIKFMGSVEVNSHKGDDVLCQAINKVALTRRTTINDLPPPMCTIEVSQYGIRMVEHSKDGYACDAPSHFFALKHISYCGTHPRNDKYFAFITKHPKDYRFACHVFLGERTTRAVNDALRVSFKRFYQEYMAFTHPTEDIYIE